MIQFRTDRYEPLTLRVILVLDRPMFVSSGGASRVSWDGGACLVSDRRIVFILVRRQRAVRSAVVAGEGIYVASVLVCGRVTPVLSTVVTLLGCVYTFPLTRVWFVSFSVSLALMPFVLHVVS